MLILRIILGLIVATIGLSTVAMAQDNASQSLLFGQKQAYTAIVRTDGKVITYGKIFLNNSAETPLSTTSFTIPDGVEVANLSVYQVLLPEECLDTKTDELTSDSSGSLRSSPYSTRLTCDNVESKTFELNDYSYYSYRNSDVELRYKPVDIKQDGATYNLALPEPIASSERGAYIVSYVANEGYVSGLAGFYNLQFKTLEVPHSVEEVRVSVDVSSDLYTKAKRSSIESSAADISLRSGADAASGAGVTNQGLDRLQSNIGSGGTFTKTGKSLLPDETFVVNGEFADAAWKLHLKLIVILLFGFAITIGLIVFLMKKADRPAKTKEARRGSKK